MIRNAYRQVRRFYLYLLVGHEGFEPSTNGLRAGNTNVFIFNFLQVTGRPLQDFA